VTPPPPPGPAPEGETARRRAAAALGALTDAERHPAVARLLGSDVFGHGDEGDTDFDFGLDRVLDGIEVLVESRR
jgi:hypothetical protein